MSGEPDAGTWLWEAMKAEMATWPRGFDPEEDVRPEGDDYSSYRGDYVANAVMRRLRAEHSIPRPLHGPWAPAYTPIVKETAV